MTKEKYLKVVEEEGTRLFGQLSFTQIAPATFQRKGGENVDHGFMLRSNYEFTSITVDVGANVPALDRRLDYVAFGAGAHCPRLMVSRPLGLLRPAGGGRTTFYYFATIEEMRGKLREIYADFVEQAEPWLAGLTTIDAVAREFYKWRVGPPPGEEPPETDPTIRSLYSRVLRFLKGRATPVLTSENRPPDPFAWTMYGWLLQEAGEADEGRSWLERAYEFLQLPEEMKAGRFIPRVGWKAQPMPPLAEENRVMHLLKKELGPRSSGTI